MVELYVEHLVLAMREVRRVLRDDGVVFLNLGDSYRGSGRGHGSRPSKLTPLCDGCPLHNQGRARSLCLIPDRVRIALSEDGWIIRNSIIWEKPNCVPESVRDRCTSSYEQIIVLTKQGRYYWNKEEAREPSVSWENDPLGGGTTPFKKDGKLKAWTMRHSNKLGSSKTEKPLKPHSFIGAGPKGDLFIANGTHGARSAHRMEMKPTRNMRDVWTINTRPHEEAHIAMFPEELVERCIRCASRPGDIILDCFAGSGTTGLVARTMGRNAVLLDISEEYVNLMRERLKKK
jgi:DNA modification methylase